MPRGEAKTKNPADPKELRTQGGADKTQGQGKGRSPKGASVLFGAPPDQTQQILATILVSGQAPGQQRQHGSSLGPPSPPPPFFEKPVFEKPKWWGRRAVCLPSHGLERRKMGPPSREIQPPLAGGHRTLAVGADLNQTWLGQYTRPASCQVGVNPASRRLLTADPGGGGKRKTAQKKTTIGAKSGGPRPRLKGGRRSRTSSENPELAEDFSLAAGGVFLALWPLHYLHCFQALPRSRAKRNRLRH